jgi:hypothetical protein
MMAKLKQGVVTDNAVLESRVAENDEDKKENEFRGGVFKLKDKG